MLPSEIAKDANSGEARIFEAIRDSKNSDGWYCLHSVGIARHKRKQYAECDFVLITDAGVFCLEVKGGEVTRKDGTWVIGWPGKSYNSKEGPFKQSQSAMQALIKELKAVRGDAFKRRVLFGWGVVFPDIEFDEQDPEWDLNVVYDSRDSSIPFADYIQRLAKYTKGHEKKLGRQFPSKLDNTTRLSIVDEFRHDFALVPLLGDILSESRKELIRLSDDQFRVLKYALNPANRRSLCPGGAGTGKTLIASEAARRIGARGKKTLFLCFNRLLADHLARAPDIDHGFVSIRSLHRFMRDEIVAAGLEHELAERQRQSANQDEYFSKLMPELFEMALLDRSPGHEFKLYDVLIVDEGQDILHSPVIDALGLVLEGGWDGGQWMVFFDPDLQSEVYGRFDESVLRNLAAQNAVLLPLDENFRNPEQIVKEMVRLTGIEKPICRRNLPVRMEYLTFEDPDEEGQQLKGLVEEIISAGVRPNDICALSALRKDDSCIQRNRSILGITVTYLEKGLPATVAPGSVLAASVSGFKGLEAEVVILTDMPELSASSSEWERSMWYVGMTRCTTKLFAIVRSEFLEKRFAD